MDRFLSDYIKRALKEIEAEKAQHTATPPVSLPSDYEVYPEDDGYDLPRNPYSRV